MTCHSISAYVNRYYWTVDTCSILFVCYYSLVRCYDSTMYIIVLLSYHVLIDMPSVSGDTGGWIPYCSHDPIMVAIKSPTPTHRYDEHIWGFTW